MPTEARQVGYMGRRAVALSAGQASLVVDELGGMVPVFGLRRGAGLLNAHWIPEFRDTSGQPWSEAAHGAYWKGKLLHHLAGDFPCAPSFGPPCTVDGVEHPAHGWTAEEAWRLEAAGVDEATGAPFARFALESPAPGLPLSFQRCDLLLPGAPAYASVLRIRNRGAAPVAVNAARHNTVGAPFLAAGCRISLPGNRFMAAGDGTEFEATGRLLGGVEFGALEAAPLREGGQVDAGAVPGPIGFTDLVAGAIPPGLALGWSCVVNPALRLAYLCFFPGVAALPPGELAPTFNILWMQYGGRPFTPWALHEGGGDRTFCLGTENGVCGFANGLAWCRAHPALLGNATTAEVPAGGERTLVYATALVPLEPALLAEGVRGVEAEAGALVLRGARAFQRVAGADLAVARAVAAVGR
ncbi:MAG: hypothetical protein QM767_07575 [Anaeromyxobacter sp.]